MASATAAALAEALEQHSHRQESGAQSRVASLGPSLLAWSLLKVQGVRSDLVFGTICYLLKFLLTLTSPLAVYELLRWYMDSSVSLAYGCLFAILHAVAVLGQHVFHKAYAASSGRAGQRCEVATAGVLYRRVLMMNVVDLGLQQTGELVNLFSVDTQNISDFWSGAIFLALQPLEITGIISLLWLVVAEATLMALGICAFTYCCLQVLGGVVDRRNEQKSRSADERLKLLAEVLHGIKVVKANGWAPRFERCIQSVAAKESRHMLSKKRWMSLVLLATIEVVDVLAFAVTAVSILLCGQRPDAARIFTMWVLMGVLHSKLFAFPEALRKVCSAWNSFRRCAHIFDAGRNRSIRSATESSPCHPEDAIEDLAICNGEFSFGVGVDRPVGTHVKYQEDRLVGSCASVLASVNIIFKHGLLHAVVGPVGSGKSSLLLGVMGEMRTSADTQVRWGARMATCAYVPQDPVVFHLTIRENVCFGKPFDKAWYERVCGVCSLDQDVASFPNGDATIVGSRGINISGGQQSRICLARAVYSGANVYLLDDPLAKLDARVSSQVFSQAILGILDGRTRIMTTNSGTVVQKADVVIKLSGGCATADEVTDASAAEVVVGDNANVEQCSDDLDGHRLLLVGEKDPPLEELCMFEDNPCTHEGRGWISGASFFWRHFVAGLGSYSGAFIYMCTLAAEIVIIEFGVHFLALWTDDPDESYHPYSWYVAMYGGCIGLECLIALVKYGLLVILTQRAWNRIHTSLLARVLHASLMWLQSVPVGHMLQLFSGALGRLEERVFNCSELWVLNGSWIVATSIACIVVYPPFAAIVAILAAVTFQIIRKLAGTSENVRPLEASLRRALLGHLTETLGGLVVVRAFHGSAANFLGRFDDLLDRRVVAQSLCSSANDSMLFQLSLVGALGYAFVGVVAVIARETTGISAGQVGFMLTNACFFSFFLTEFVVNTLALLEVAHEREIIHRLQRLAPQEGGPVVEKLEARVVTWPSKGLVCIENLDVRYKAELPLVLKGFSLEVFGGEHIGIVGRTGSGKSSLLLSICRLVEPAAGHVVIDGIDVAHLGLQELRTHLGVLSQDPLFFSGSLRENLDPFGEYDDSTLWRELVGVGLAELFSNEALDSQSHRPRKGSCAGLGSTVTELGGNFSVGQRQLLCLARAALRRPRIVLVDEATAALDVEADARVQSVLHKRFTAEGATMLQVAHRLRSVATSDRVAVLESGSLVELGSPLQLLVEEPPRGGRRFQELVASLGDKDAAEYLTAVHAWQTQQPTVQL